MAKRKRKPAPASRPRRPVLGNDPFERGAAPRPVAPSAAAPRASVPVPPPAAATPAPAPPPPPRSTHAGGGEARLAEAARRTGPAAYADELRELLVRLRPALRDAVRPLASLATLLATPAHLDAHGMDPELVDRARPIIDFFLDTWWRVEVHGESHLPEGPAVVVANHGGTLPWDATVLRAVAARLPSPRLLRPLLEPRTLASPLLGRALVRLGAAPLRSDVALALLASGSSVAVFPEGPREAPRDWSDRYRLSRFGRGGFARVAALANVPIVPCAIVGSEEAAAPLDRRGWLAESLHLPLLALAPALPFSSPLGWLPLPSRWTVRFDEPIPAPSLEAASDPEAVAAAGEAVRVELQRLLDADLAGRRSIFV